MTSAAYRRCLGPLVAALGFAVLACGGTGSSADRKAVPKTRPNFYDPGSLKVYSCSADQRSSGIITQVLEDWELPGGTGLSAGNGWYTNNDRCESCQFATNDIRDAEPDKDKLLDPDLLKDGLAEFRQCTPDCLAAQIPSYFDKPVPAEAIANGGRCASKYAFHVIAGPFTKWGGQLGHAFNPPLCATGSQCPDDQTNARIAPAENDPMPDAPYEGIAFWARAVPGSGSSLRIQVGESHTDIKYPLTLDNPPCVDNVGVQSPNDTTTGCDTFGAFVTLNSDWQLILLPFEEMRQAGWGKRAPFFDIQHISNITFFYAQGVWDIWIDDIFFYKRSAP